MPNAAIQPIGPDSETAVLALNEANIVATSPLAPGELHRLIGEAFYARRVGGPVPDEVDAFLLAFDQDADYGSPNFRWFKARYPRFVYVDRIVVAAAARGRGYARLLYSDLFTYARAAGHERIVCEVNLDPPNPASDAFHAALGFAEEGRATLPGSGKVVRYLVKAL